MRVAQLVKHGNEPSCFQIAEVDKPTPAAGEILIKVQAFGLNYADVMARLGLYRDAPPIPSVLGYDVVGIAESIGQGVDKSILGKHVVAVTEFGGYAEYAIAHKEAVVEIPASMPFHAAAALATQYATAYYAVFLLGNVQPGDRVFIHAAAGGVGLALVQFCKLKNCVIYATVSNDTKAFTIAQMGVHHVINTSKQNVLDELKKLERQLDIIFDSVGGRGFRMGIKALRPGGRIVFYGGAQLGEGRGILHMLRFALSVGIYSPIQFFSQSKSLLGINMLKLMRGRPQLLEDIMKGTLRLLDEGRISMRVGKTFAIDELFQAHAHLQSRQSIGKIAVKW